MKQFSKSELQIMKYLWAIEKGFLKDIVDQFPDPAPAYTTISTLISRMVKKGYIGFEKYGRDKQYYPKITKTEYFKNHFKEIVSGFFNNSSRKFNIFQKKHENIFPEYFFIRIIFCSITNINAVDMHPTRRATEF